MATFVEDASLRLYYGGSEGLQQRVEVVGVLTTNGSEGEEKGEIPASLFNLQLMTSVGMSYNNTNDVEASFVIDNLRTSIHGVDLLTGGLSDALNADHNITIVGIE